jgi:hypothetical protein
MHVLHAEEDSPTKLILQFNVMTNITILYLKNMKGYGEIFNSNGEYNIVKT